MLVRHLIMSCFAFNHLFFLVFVFLIFPLDGSALSQFVNDNNQLVGFICSKRCTGSGLMR